MAGQSPCAKKMKKNSIAIDIASFLAYGCPQCGCDQVIQNGLQTNTTIISVCCECQYEFVTLLSGATMSDIGVLAANNSFVYLKKQEHPRKDIPRHAYDTPDVQPPTGGEYWMPRSINYDLPGFIRSKNAGNRILSMIKDIIKKETLSWMDYRPTEPNRIQIKINQSDGFDLEQLRDLCIHDGIITHDRLQKAYINKP